MVQYVFSAIRKPGTLVWLYFLTMWKTITAPFRTFIGLLRDPRPFYRSGAKLLVKMLYRTKFSGFEQIPNTGAGIIIANHVSYMDGLILHTACHRPVVFIIDEEIYKIPLVKYFLDLNGAIPVLPNRDSVTAMLEEVSRRLEKGELVCIFPEGMLTYTGNMSRFKFGIEWIIQHNPVPIYPVALKGLWGSILSRKYRKQSLLMRLLPRGFRRRVSAICGAPIPPGKARLSYLQRVVMDLKNRA
ncbi:MAG: 1-acyl-sn-glycerol-3-phosphate acyltransferase [Hyphomicrobiales bacterium]|nr:1-acyl-sn-glycerol-3-phosphate acyltransferase [Hyphomicrobiales bacterium]